MTITIVALRTKHGPQLPKELSNVLNIRYVQIQIHNVIVTHIAEK
jgi:hypothetical protein